VLPFPPFRVARTIECVNLYTPSVHPLYVVGQRDLIVKCPTPEILPVLKYFSDGKFLSSSVLQHAASLRVDETYCVTSSVGKWYMPFINADSASELRVWTFYY
jgi:hypothetical protein